MFSFPKVRLLWNMPSLQRFHQEIQSFTVDLNITYRLITAYEYGASSCYCHRTQKYISQEITKTGGGRVDNCQTTRYLHIMGDAVTTVGCLDQDQDDDDRYEGPHNFLLIILVRSLRSCSCARTNKIEAHVSHQECLRSFCSTSIVTVVVCALTNLVATHAGSTAAYSVPISAFQVYRFSGQACARKIRANDAQPRQLSGSELIELFIFQYAFDC